MKSGHRIIGYDLMRTIAIFMVVAIHSHVVYLGRNQGSIGWLIVMELTAICLVSVPLFFMISGALLLDSDCIIGIRELFTRRLPKQFIPFIFWSLIYTILRIAMGKIPLSIESFAKLLYEPAYYQFWFMYTLLAIYLLLPVLQAMVSYLNQKQIEYMLILWFIFSIVVPSVSHFIDGFMISEHIDLILCEGYIGYFLLGYYLKKYKRKCKINIAVILTVVGILLTGIAAYVEWLYSINHKMKYVGYVYQSYLLPGVVLSVIGIFLIFQRLEINHKSISKKIVIKLSELSMGVFYIHMLILIVMEHLGVSGEKSIIILAVKTVLIYVLSLIGTYIINLVPVLRRVLLGRRN